MHRILPDPEGKLLAPWVADRVAWCSGPEAFYPCSGLAVVRGDRVLAGVVYHDWHPYEGGGVIEISMAADSPMWARRENIRALLHYPFRQVGAWKVRVTTPHTQTHNIKTFEHIGFTREAVLANEYGRKLHAWVGRMQRPDYSRLYEE